MTVEPKGNAEKLRNKNGDIDVCHVIRTTRYKTDTIYSPSNAKKMLLETAERRQTMTQKTNKINPAPAANKETRWRHNENLANRKTLEEMLIKIGTIQEIAEQTHTSRYQVYRAIKSHGIDKETIRLKRYAWNHQNRIPEKHIMEFPDTEKPWG